MNALKARKRYDAEQNQKVCEERRKHHEEWLANMTDEERIEYEEQERKRSERLLHTLAPLEMLFDKASYYHLNGGTKK